MNRPDPGPGAVLFGALQKIIEIMPPQIMLAYGDVIKIPLMGGSFFIHAGSVIRNRDADPGVVPTAADMEASAFVCEFDGIGD